MIKKHITKRMIVTFIITNIMSAIIGYGINYVLPSKLPEKELTCVLDYSQYLVQKTIDDPNLELLYMGKKVDEPYIMSITIKNTGDYPIDNIDFKDKFSIIFNDSVKVLSCNIRKTSNDYVLSEVLKNANIEKNKITISDFMLNTSEGFTLNIILDRKSDSIKYDYRVNGINEIKIRNTKQEKNIVLKIITFFIILISAGFTLFSIYIERKFNRKMQLLNEKYEKN